MMMRVLRGGEIQRGAGQNPGLGHRKRSCMPEVVNGCGDRVLQGNLQMPRIQK